MKGFGIYVKNNLLEPKHVEKMGGSALFLYLWLLDKMTSVNENGIGKVLGNRPITYELVTADLGISLRTYRRWVEKLEDEGYINTLRAPYGLVITVHKAEKIFGKRSAKSGTSLPKRSAINGTSDMPKVAHQNAKTGTSNKDNTRTIQLDNTSKANKSPEHEEISKLYYQIIKVYKLPLVNNNNIRKWIKQMTTEVEHDKLKEYLLFMRDQYQNINIDFKPHINNALDIYSKRVQIENAMKSAIKEAAEHKVFRV